MDTVTYRRADCEGAGCGAVGCAYCDPVCPPSEYQGYRAERRAVPQDPRLGPTQNVLREFPEDAAERKGLPIATGVIDYFPLALMEIARLSKAGNDQHNPGQPLHWSRGKSSDHADCLIRHFIQRGSEDSDGISHTAKVAWRALAMLQEELEAKAGFDPSEGGADA